MSKPKLIIGNKNYSSWSLRAWLLLAKLGLDFEEERIALFSEGFKERILSYSPAGQVPIYIDGDVVVWDTLAIAEYLAEAYPQLWPRDAAQRAYARSVAAEMHSGFAALRNAMPMNCRATGRQVPLSEPLAADIQRVQSIWTDCRGQHTQGGPWLFGDFTVADAMYAPVVFRFHTYGVNCDAMGSAYIQTVLGDSEVTRWAAAAASEKETIDSVEVGQ